MAPPPVSPHNCLQSELPVVLHPLSVPVGQHSPDPIPDRKAYATEVHLHLHRRHIRTPIPDLTSCPGWMDRTIFSFLPRLLQSSRSTKWATWT